MKNIIKENLLFLIIVIAFVLLISASTTYAAILFDSANVNYNNTSSGLSATKVQDAIDELYTKGTDYTTLESRTTTLETKNSNFATFKYSSPSAKSIASNSSTFYYTGASVQLTAGTWLVAASGGFASTSTSGHRYIIMYEEDTCSTSVGGILGTTVVPAVSTTNSTIIGFASILEPTSTQTFYLCARQNSGSALNVTPAIIAIKIK